MQTKVEKINQTRRLNAAKRAMIIQNIVAERFEPGNQSKSRSQVFRQYVSKYYPMSERTFWFYMGMDVKKEFEKARYGQLELFD